MVLLFWFGFCCLVLVGSGCWLCWFWLGICYCWRFGGNCCSGLICCVVWAGCWWFWRWLGSVDIGLLMLWIILVGGLLGLFSFYVWFRWLGWFRVCRCWWFFVFDDLVYLRVLVYYWCVCGWLVWGLLVVVGWLGCWLLLCWSVYFLGGLWWRVLVGNKLCCSGCVWYCVVLILVFVDWCLFWLFVVCWFWWLLGLGCLSCSCSLVGFGFGWYWFLVILCIVGWLDGCWCWRLGLGLVLVLGCLDWMVFCVSWVWFRCVG